MAEDKRERAKKVFDTACEALVEREWEFSTDGEKLKIKTRAIGDDLPMDITIHADADRQLLMVISHLPVTVPEDRRVDLAIAVSIINNQLVDGSFDYDLRCGSIFFRLTSSFLDSTIGKEAVMYMLMCSCTAIDEYNDKLFMLAKGFLSIEQFIAAETN